MSLIRPGVTWEHKSGVRFNGTYARREWKSLFTHLYSQEYLVRVKMIFSRHPIIRHCWRWLEGGKMFQIGLIIGMCAICLISFMGENQGLKWGLVYYSSVIVSIFLLYRDFIKKKNKEGKLHLRYKSSVKSLYSEDKKIYIKKAATPTCTYTQRMHGFLSSLKLFTCEFPHLPLSSVKYCNNCNRSDTRIWKSTCELTMASDENILFSTIYKAL